MYEAIGGVNAASPLPRPPTPRQMTRVLFLSRLFSPFQIEVGNAARAVADLDYRIAFTMRSREARLQPHWTSFEHDEDLYPVAPEGADSVRWLCSEIDRLKPDVVLAGQPLFDLHAAVVRSWRPNRFRLGYWMEPPDFRHPAWRQVAATRLLSTRLGYADFLLSIGERAERAYRPCAKQARHYLVPYGEDLTACLKTDILEKRTKLTFLYSGQLRKHHDIKLLCEAIRQVERERPGQFNVVISGDGPERVHIDALLAKAPSLAGRLTYESTFATWGDRLTPFKTCHVLLYPCVYTGWGLVIPEAMASGMCVISTRNAEAARYYVRHRANGIITDLSRGSFAREMIACIDDRAMVERLGAAAQITAREGDATVIANQISTAILAPYPAHDARRARAHRVDAALANVSRLIGR